ncbi:hypothetical protein Y88_0929 [Novosphingobium nitrogenifigens DSM 19370]|uniref:Uncharacterized protein n=1 Tax=Novosphingobium nitrogenifigens DSM 19370 TaxID=983920 RepID=F1Z8X1_9SPHN|nr:hypothetical protein [Novosphingobium nitrogenifigens]EGD58868.1 hypothetical protein Y88_0929 [Novosphingobium nitrogenifigens DSM 19370]
MIVSLVAAALTVTASPAAAPASTGLIGCHPHPGKIVACVTPYGGPRMAPKPKAAKPAVEAPKDREAEQVAPTPVKSTEQIATTPATGA